MKISLLTICTFVLVGSHISVAEYSPASASTTHSRFEQDGQASSKSSSLASLGSSSRIPRQSRCIRCSYPYDDKYGYGSRDYSHSDYDYYGQTYGGNNRYNYGGGGGDGISRTGYDDRNWYYYSDRRDDRLNRYPDRYGSSPMNVVEPSAPRKYDDRYASRTYDRYDMPYGYGYERNDYRNSYNDYRGNGYDNNRDYYGSSGAAYYKDQTYDRFRGGYEGRYNDRDIYDRNTYRAPYDFRNYRPWDETYRGQSGFDNSGRGYYFASLPDDSPPSHYRPRPAPPPHPYHDDERNSYPPRPSRPYSPLPPPRPIHDLPNNAGSSSGAPGDSSAPSSPHSSGSVSGSSSSSSASGAGSTGSQASPSSRPYPYDDRPSRPGDESNRGGYAGRWTYLDDRDKGSGYHDNDRNTDRNREPNRDSDIGGGRNKDSQSTAYGTRPRPLGGAYLLDRDTNKAVAINGENKDSKIDDQTKMSAIASNEENTSAMSASGSSSSGDNTKN